MTCFSASLPGGFSFLGPNRFAPPTGSLHELVKKYSFPSSDFTKGCEVLIAFFKKYGYILHSLSGIVKEKEKYFLCVK
jgi:hypothetical protein